MKWPVKASIAFIGFLLLVAATAAWLAPYDYDLQNVPNAYGSPSGANWFGTDALGRDLLSRLIYGCRISMSIALVTAASSVLIGLVYGTIAGYVGGNVEKLMMRVIDILYTLPSLIVMILVMLVFGRNLLGIFIALTATGWLGTARLMRAQVNSWKSRPFVEAARSLGLPHRSIVLKHILGIGIRPPTPSWGILAEEGWRSLQIHPHLTIFPGVAIFLTMLSFNFIGDYLRDRLDPFLQGR
jgi:oligopeptide transport system permease protein